MATLKKIPDSYLTPARTLPEQEMADCYITNPAAARLLTYGTRDPRLTDPPHDHGQDGGEVRVDVPLVSITFGPEKTAVGPQVGISVQRTLALGTTPRILGTAGVPLRAGQSQLSGWVYMAFDVIEQATLYVTLRPYAEANRNLQAGLNATAQLVMTPSIVPQERFLGFDLDNLASMGDTRYDREVEVVVWQAYLPPVPATSGHRLLGVYLDTKTIDTRARDAERSELPRQTISYADIKTGAILGQDLGRKLRDTHNGLLRGMLGRAPGLTNDGRSDPTRPYQQDLFCAHSHQGLDVPDGCGSFWSDGAVIRDTLFAVSFYHANPVAALTEDYSGALIHSTGTFEAASLRVECRASIPAGLGAIDLRFELKVATSQPATRLFVHADVRGFDGVSICTGISSGVHQQQSTQDSDGLYLCEVDPLDNNLFVPGRKRRLSRGGLWTLAGLRFPVPAAGMRPSNHQISETVRLSLTHPKIDPANTPHQTADYMVILRWELQTPEGATAADAGARVNWALGLSARGF